MEPELRGKALNFRLAPYEELEGNERERGKLFLDATEQMPPPSNLIGRDSDGVFNKEAERELEELKKSAEVVLPPPYLNNNENYYARKERMNSITGGAEFFALVPVMTACALDLATHNRNFSLTRATLRTYGRTAAYLTRASIKAAPELIKFSRKTIETVAKILASCTRKK